MQERFAKIKISKSPPIVPFRETAVTTPTAGGSPEPSICLVCFSAGSWLFAELAPTKVPGAARGTAIGVVLDGVVTLQIRALPLPQELTDFLKANTDGIRAFVDGRMDSVGPGQHTGKSLLSKISSLLQQAGPTWEQVAGMLRAFGPRGCGPNMLFDMAGSGQESYVKIIVTQQNPLCHTEIFSRSIWRKASAHANGDGDHAAQGASEGKDDSGKASTSRSFLESIDTAFHLATLRGPLCAEPMEGLAFFIERIDLAQTPEAQEAGKTPPSSTTRCIEAN